MSEPISRRTFLFGLGGLAGLATAGLAWALTRSSAPPPVTTAAAPPSSTSTTLAPPPVTTTPPTTAAAPRVASIGVISREAWGAAPAEPGMIEHHIDRLTVHHTARLLEDNREAPEVLRAWRRAHGERGWHDVAYHYLIDGEGHVYEARDVRYRGDTRTDYDTTGHFLVACEGNFEEQQPTRAQLDSLVQVLAWAAVEFDVEPDTIAGHRDYAATACPGEALYAGIVDGSLQTAVAATVPKEVRLLPYGEGKALVATIESGRA